MPTTDVALLRLTLVDHVALLLATADAVLQLLMHVALAATLAVHHAMLAVQQVSAAWLADAVAEWDLASKVAFAVLLARFVACSQESDVAAKLHLLADVLHQLLLADATS